MGQKSPTKSMTDEIKLTPEEEAELKKSATGEGKTPEKPTGGETPETPAAEKPEEESKELKSALAQKDHFRTKYEEEAKKRAELEEKLSKPGTAQSVPTDPMEIIKLAKAVQDYSAEEVEFASRTTTDKSPVGLIKALNDDWVKTAIQGMRDKVAKEQAIPASSSPSGFPSKEKEITDKTPKDEVEDITKERFQKAEKEEKLGEGWGV
jgi:hypothetical protein